MLWIVLDLALRTHIAYFLVEVLANPEDPRFAGKALGQRNFVIVTMAGMLFPLLHLLRLKWHAGPARWKRYPWALDSLYLSLFWLDGAGNSFDLYDSYQDFDLIPHFHGTGVLAIVVERVFGTSPLRTFGISNGIHVALEAQELLTDVFFGTHNVRGAMDTIRDVTVGIAGTIVYPIVGRMLARRR